MSPNLFITGAVRLYVEVRSPEYMYEAPTWARIDLTQSQLERILHMREIVHRENLTEVRQWDHPGRWQNEGEECRLEGGQLVVDKNHFWFSASPKYFDGYVETVMISIDTLLEALQGPEVARQPNYVRGHNMLIWSSHDSQWEELDDRLHDLKDDGEDVADFENALKALSK